MYVPHSLSQLYIVLLIPGSFFMFIFYDSVLPTTKLNQTALFNFSLLFRFSGDSFMQLSQSVVIWNYVFTQESFYYDTLREQSVDRAQQDTGLREITALAVCCKPVSLYIELYEQHSLTFLSGAAPHWVLAQPGCYCIKRAASSPLSSSGRGNNYSHIVFKMTLFFFNSLPQCQHKEMSTVDFNRRAGDLWTSNPSSPDPRYYIWAFHCVRHVFI